MFVRILKDCGIGSDEYKSGQFVDIENDIADYYSSFNVVERAGCLSYRKSIDFWRYKRTTYKLGISEIVDKICNGFEDSGMLDFLEKSNARPSLIDDYDWVNYTDYDFEFIEDIIKAFPPNRQDKRLLFWECVYGQYHKYCTTKDYEQKGLEKKDFEERLEAIKPLTLYNAFQQICQTKRKPTIIYQTLQTETSPKIETTETSSEAESSAPTKETFDIDKARETLKDYFIAKFKGMSGNQNYYENFIEDFKRLAEASSKMDLCAFLLIAYNSKEINKEKKPQAFKRWLEICSDCCGMTITGNYKPNRLEPIAKKKQNTYYYFNCEWKDESQK